MSTAALSLSIVALSYTTLVAVGLVAVIADRRKK